ncbi:MAG: Tim44-like domain-containing protein [Methylobacter sp.]|uniref:Tim44 domain-containing protein n=1 Tax=Methylobacter sp. TaxID=2051955 RepID=UPI00273188C5|nr:Tim44-like domain-containing protein [Methylobacter sp.]MDP1664080.1 Tim44-like domain-containing protein [Methylobacter sp.]MDP1970359.1 Tim44-like domain-containing protein [Methylobacter sp.]
MNKYTGIIATLLMGLSLTLAEMSDADAKRFGGGSSFGGRSSYSAPYQRSVTPPARPAQQQAATPNPAATPAAAGRSGLMGMLGGLALGGLLGSLFAGGGFQGINFMDILIFGGIAFLLYKWFAAKKASATPRPAYNRTADNNYQVSPPNQTDPAGFDTDILFGDKHNTATSGALGQSAQQNAEVGTANVPANFDQKGFLIGAKIAFTELQKAWDERDLAEIRGLTTDKVFAEIQDQLKASTTENRTEVLKLEAELLEVREVGSELEAVVLFDSIMREDSNAQAEQVREVWHFIKPKVSIQSKWYLDGIQQLED